MMLHSVLNIMLLTRLSITPGTPVDESADEDVSLLCAPQPPDEALLEVGRCDHNVMHLHWSLLGNNYCTIDLSRDHHWQYQDCTATVLDVDDDDDDSSTGDNDDDDDDDDDKCNAG